MVFLTSINCDSMIHSDSTKHYGSTTLVGPSEVINTNFHVDIRKRRSLLIVHIPAYSLLLLLANLLGDSCFPDVLQLSFDWISAKCDTPNTSQMEHITKKKKRNFNFPFLKSCIWVCNHYQSKIPNNRSLLIFLRGHEDIQRACDITGPDQINDILTPSISIQQSRKGGWVELIDSIKR